MTIANNKNCLCKYHTAQAFFGALMLYGLFSSDADVLEFDAGFGASYIYAQFELGASLVE